MKSEIRKEALELRESMPEMYRNTLNIKIFNGIKEWDLYQNAECVMLYASFRSEVNTWSLIEDCLSQGKRVVLPKTVREGTRIVPCLVNDLNDLVRTKFGVMEPDANRSPEAETNDIDLILVPGAAFDLKGGRIGYGAGYYDRFLKKYKGIKAGMCFYSQIVSSTLSEEHDVAMDYLVTDMGIINIGDK